MVSNPVYGIFVTVGVEIVEKTLTDETTLTHVADIALQGAGHIHSREQIIGMLGEASEVEHNLMLTYLYAAFSLKTEDSDGLKADQLDAVRRWQRSVLRVAIEEMGHLAIVANLLVAVGGAPRFDRSDFPIAPGALPAGIGVRLAPFTRETLQHFIFLERPLHSEETDGPGFGEYHDYKRGALAQTRMMPTAYDYDTVGELYDNIYDSLVAIQARYGAAPLFVGDAVRQVGPEITPLPGLMTITSLEDARHAIEVIVEQGEGATTDNPNSHYNRFLAIRKEWDDMLVADPDFVPGRPVADNPVMRCPPTPDGKTWVTDPQAARVLDYCNALYIQMLRLLSQAFGRPGDTQDKRALVNAATDIMHAMTPAAEALTTMRAASDAPCNAGMTFSTVRGMSALPIGTEWVVLHTRFLGLVRESEDLRGIHDKVDRSIDMLAGISATFARQVSNICGEQFVVYDGTDNAADDGATLPESAK